MAPTVHVCCFMLERASTKTFVSRGITVFSVFPSVPVCVHKRLFKTRNILAKLPSAHDWTLICCHQVLYKDSSHNYGCMYACQAVVLRLRIAARSDTTTEALYHTHLFLNTGWCVRIRLAAETYRLHARTWV